MKQLSEERIDEIAVQAVLSIKNGESLVEMIKRPIRAALSEAAQPEPAKPEWPKLPVRVAKYNIHGRDDAGTWGVQTANGEWLISSVLRQRAEIFAAALNMLPRLVAWMRKHSASFPSAFSNEHWKDCAESRDAMLAQVDSANFEMPECDK